MFNDPWSDLWCSLCSSPKQLLVSCESLGFIVSWDVDIETAWWMAWFQIYRSIWHYQCLFNAHVSHKYIYIYNLKWPIFCYLLRPGNLPLCLAPENGPHQVPRKRAFSWVSQRKLDTWWGPFSGANPSGKLALRWFPPLFFSTSSCLFGT